MSDAVVALNPVPKRNVVIALVDAHPKSVLLLYAARRRAREVGGRWRAVYIETPGASPTDNGGAQERVLRMLTLAEQMGGEVQQLHAASFEQGLRQLLDTEQHQLAWIILGDDQKRTWRKPSWWPRSAHKRMLDYAKRITRIEYLPLGATIQHPWTWRHLRPERPRYLVYALLSAGGAYAIAELFHAILPPALFQINIQNISLLFLTAAAFTAGRYGLIPGLLSGFTGAIIYNYFYVPPYHNFNLLNVTTGLSMILFLSAGALIAVFAGQGRLHAQRSERRERGAQVLLMLYRVASSAFSRQQAMETLREKLFEMLHIEVAFFMPPMMQPDHIESVVPTAVALDENDQQALEACWAEAKITGIAAPSYANAHWRFKPMITSNGVIGVFAMRPRDGGSLEPWLGGLLAGIADQIAIIIEHYDLNHMMEATRIREEREKLRAMLLSSVSHDLKTPLSGIIGSLSVHRSVGARLSAERREELLDDALEEARRLDSFITNILDVTRLESGTVEFHPEWHDLNGIVRVVAKRMQHRLQTRRVIITPCPEMIEAYCDGVMTEQVLQNLLDNACKYTPNGTQINIRSYVREGSGLYCDVHDHGSGIPVDKLTSIFDKYARLQKTDTQVAGTGLGLSICKVIMETQGGWIHAANHPDGGAVFTICFPQWRTVTMEEPTDIAVAAGD